MHNGIIENHDQLRRARRAEGHLFTSETDTEVIVHAICDELQPDRHLLEAVRLAVSRLDGAYALGVVHVDEPERLVAARHGSSLVIGLGIGENFIASDVVTLLPVTQRFIFTRGRGYC